MIRTLIVFVLVALAAATWWQHRARQAVATVITDLRPHVLLRYEGLRAWPGQPVTLHGVTLEPVGAWREALNLPIGYRVHARTLSLDTVEPASRRRVITLDGLQIRVDGLPAVLGRPLQRSDLTMLSGRLTLDIQPPLDGLPWQLSAWLDLTQGLSATLSGRWVFDSEAPALTREGITLVDAQLNIEERGLLQRLQQSGALAKRLPVGAWASETLDHLLETIEAKGWTVPASAKDLLQQGLRSPQSFSLTLAPPTPVRLDQISLYAPDDRWLLLGVSAELSPP